MKKKKPRMPTSKKLAYLVAYTWVSTVIFTCMMLIFKIDALGILISVSGTFGVVLSGFYAKSYLENKSKYSNENNNDEDGV